MLVKRILIGLALLGIALAWCSCAPQTVKQSHQMSVQAVTVAHEQATQAEKDNEDLDLTAIILPLQDALRLMGPVGICLGTPRVPVQYDPFSNAAELLAKRAGRDAAMLAAVTKLGTIIADKFTPEGVKTWLKIPPPQEQMDWKELLAWIVGGTALGGGLRKTPGKLYDKLKNRRTDIG